MATVTLKPLSGPGAGVPLPAIRGVITMPRAGAWHANLWLDGSAKPTGKVEIKAGALTLLGTLNRSSLSQGIVRARVVAGGDGLRKVATAKHYTSPTAALVLAELAKGGGEAVSPTADSSALVLGRTLLAWTTLAIETVAMIDCLVTVCSSEAVWRHLPDGSIWVGKETFPDSKITDYREIDESPEDGWVVLGMDVPRLLPGTTIGGRRVDLVEHVITPEETRTKLWVAAS